MKNIAIFLILMLLVGSIGASADRGAVSEGKAYTLSVNPSAAYPDDGKKLTDGATATLTDKTYHKSGAYVGINRSSLDESGKIDIVVDLGKTYDELTGFALSYDVEPDAGIYAPESVMIMVSDSADGIYTSVGTVQTTEPAASGTVKTGVAEYKPDKAVSGRYVRFTVQHPLSASADDGTEITAGWIFIDEITVYAETGTTPQTGAVREAWISILLGSAMIITCSGIVFAGIIKKRRLKS